MPNSKSLVVVVADGDVILVADWEATTHKLPPSAPYSYANRKARTFVPSAEMLLLLLLLLVFCFSFSCVSFAVGVDSDCESGAPMLDFNFQVLPAALLLLLLLLFLLLLLLLQERSAI